MRSKNLLINPGIYLEEEGYVSGFIGVIMEHDVKKSMLEEKKIYFISQINESLVFNVGNIKVSGRMQRQHHWLRTNL